MKKPVQKKSKGGKMLAMLSPAAAIGQSLKSGRAEGLLGMGTLGALINQDKKRDRKADGQVGPSGPSAPTGMKAGGKVTRGDGVCTKGHTKGKMV